MIFIDSNGYSTQAGVHPVSLSVVIYALLLDGLRRKEKATQSCVCNKHNSTYKQLAMTNKLQITCNVCPVFFNVHPNSACYLDIQPAKRLI